MNIYRKTNGLISFRKIPSNIKYNNKLLIKILNELLINNSITNWKKSFKDANNICINNNKLNNNKLNNNTNYKYIGIGGDNDELLNSSYIGYTEINEKNMDNINLNNGIYSYIITYDEDLFSIHINKILPFEMFTKHINLLQTIYQKYKKVKILGSGECKINDDTITFNLKSGHVMKNIMKDSCYNITKKSYNKNSKSHIEYWWEPLISFIFKKLLSNYTNKYVSNGLINKNSNDIDLFNKLLSKYELDDNIKLYRSENNCLNDKNGNYL